MHSQDLLGPPRTSQDLLGPQFPCRILVRSIVKILGLMLGLMLGLIGIPRNARNSYDTKIYAYLLGPPRTSQDLLGP